MENKFPQRGAIYLECSECHQHWDSQTSQTVCPACTAPLLPRYNIEWIRQTLTRDQIAVRPRGLWRWAELLPVQNESWQISLGEGDTPLLSLPHISKQLGLPNLYLKDESRNPTNSFKARGIAVALSRHLELGVRHFMLATAGNAGATLAAYVARAQQKNRLENCTAHIFMPRSAPYANQREVQLSGADLHQVDGLISDAARQAHLAAQSQQNENWFDLSTFKEPYRVEGKKTMGFELAEQFHWNLPHVIVYPTGGGTGLIGLWKAFEELELLGWIDSRRPRFISVQAAGCAPVVRAFQEGSTTISPWENAHTIASGLCVPKPFADRLLLRTLIASKGVALSVSEEEILQAQSTFAQMEGIFASPESAAAFAGLIQALHKGLIGPDEQIVLFHTASGLKYL
ncbi:MAG: threonine synthase [Anaerolineales bacterium]